MRLYLMRNILLLEDEVIIALSVKKSIQDNCEAEVYLAHDPSTALKIAREVSLDLLIADVNLQAERDGIDVATQLFSLYGLPTVFLTSYTDEETIKRASKVDVIGYLTKPFREEEIIAQMKVARFRFVNESEDHKEIGEHYYYDEKSRELIKDGDCINLTVKEHQLFLTLLNAEGRPVPFAYVDELVWPGDTISAGTRRQLFYRLRNKIPDLDLDTVNSNSYVLKY